MASANDEIDALMRAEIYKSKEELMNDALRALLSIKNTSLI